MNKIRIKQYEQTADEKVSFNGIKWLRKWDVCVQCDSAEEAEALRARLAQPEPAECDGGQCGIGGYCKQCPKTQPEPEPVAWCIVENGRIHGLVKSKPAVMNAEKWQPLYTAPPQREWQGLTDEEIMSLLPGAVRLPPGWADTVRVIEAKLKEKNT